MMSITSISISKFIRETEKGQKNSITRERGSEEWEKNDESCEKHFYDHIKSLSLPQSHYNNCEMKDIPYQKKKTDEGLGAFEKAMKNVRRHFNII